MDSRYRKLQDKMSLDAIEKLGGVLDGVGLAIAQAACVAAGECGRESITAGDIADAMDAFTDTWDREDRMAVGWL